MSHQLIKFRQGHHGARAAMKEAEVTTCVMQTGKNIIWSNPYETHRTFNTIGTKQVIQVDTGKRLVDTGMNKTEATFSVIARVNDANKEILSLLKLLPQETQFASDLVRRNSILQSELDIACKTIEALRLEVIAYPKIFTALAHGHTMALYCRKQFFEFVP